MNLQVSSSNYRDILPSIPASHQRSTGTGLVIPAKVWTLRPVSHQTSRHIALRHATEPLLPIATSVVKDHESPKSESQHSTHAAERGLGGQRRDVVRSVFVPEHIEEY
jgi:hypothetical protein